MAGDPYRTFHCELLLLGTYATLFFLHGLESWTSAALIMCIFIISQTCRVFEDDIFYTYGHQYGYCLEKWTCAYVLCRVYDYDMIFSFD